MPTITYEEAAQRVHEAGMRMTAPRQTLLRLVLANEQPFSVEHLYAQALEAGLECSLSTVYRNLEAFVQVHLVDEIPGDGTRLYSWHDSAETGAHVFCLDCRRMTTLAGMKNETGAPDNALSQALSQGGFDASTVRMMLAAHCMTKTCAEDDLDAEG
jgi:Fe2+ or Zn2+ uptake regulation protein